MAVKSFIFRQNWVARKVAGMKKNFFAIFDPTWTHFRPQKSQIRNSFNRTLFKKDRNYIIINFVTLSLTNETGIIENNQFFAIFELNQTKIWP